MLPAIKYMRQNNMKIIHATDIAQMKVKNLLKARNVTDVDDKRNAFMQCCSCKHWKNFNNKQRA